MKIEKDKVVSIDYTLSDSEDEVVDSSEEGGPLFYLHGNGNLVPGLEKALEGKMVGDSLQVSIPPKDGYGVHDDSKVGQVPRSALTELGEIELGMQFEARTPEGEDTVVTVIDIGPEMVTLDGNHPLAGETLNFDVIIRDIRDATADELAHGHVHGPEGHAH